MTMKYTDILFICPAGGDFYEKNFGAIILTFEPIMIIEF